MGKVLCNKVKKVGLGRGKGSGGEKKKDKGGTKHN